MGEKAERLWSIDAARGLSVMLMIVLHLGLVVYLAESTIYDIGLFQPEPFFILVAGLSSPILLTKRYVKEDKRVLLVRGGLLILIDLAMVLTASIIWPSVYTFRLYWGVFQIIGLSYFILFVILMFSEMDLKKGLALFIGLVVASPLMSFLGIGLFGNMFFNLAYFFAGVCLYFFVYQRKISIVWPVLALAVAYLICYLFAIDPLAWSYWAFGKDPVMAIMVVSLNIAVVVKLFSMLDNSKLATKALSFMSSLGKISFSIFVAHMLIMYALMRLVLLLSPGAAIPVHDELLYVLLLIFVIGLFVAVEKVWRRYDYKFGLEWFFRKGVVWILDGIDAISHHVRKRSEPE